MIQIDLSWAFRRLKQVYSLPYRLTGEPYSRQNPCGFCGSTTGENILRMDYWDLNELKLVKCSDCGLMQVDPMPSAEDMALGCHAFFLFEKNKTGKREIQRTCVRNFRKGVAFGIELRKLGYNPKRSLELGAGDAYFSRGLQAAFPGLEAVCLDVVPEVLEQIRQNHGFYTLEGAAENLDPQLHGTYDLIIARDILEHVAEPGLVLQKISSLLRPKGLLHFITPNGHEDLWFSFGLWKRKQQPVEMLINHVNYFDPIGLREKIESLKLTPKQWYIYDFKGFRMGKGRRVVEKYLNTPSTKRSAAEVIKTLSKDEIILNPTERAELLNLWWRRWPWLARLYCRVKHGGGYYVDADLSIGHEIFCLAEKH